MMILRVACVSVLALAAAVSCGGSQAAPATTPPPSPAASSSAHDETEGLSPETHKAVAEAKAEQSAPVTTHGDGPVALPNLFGKPSPAEAKSFPKATNTDAGCVGKIGIGGKHDEDYQEVAAQCGTGTGMKEYTSKATGHIGPKHPRDVYSFKMLGGLCYRFFAVGDSSIANINIRIERPDGSLLSIDATKQPVAILDPDRAWCKTHDRDFRVVVETTGQGEGDYAFGIWARPK